MPSARPWIRRMDVIYEDDALIVVDKPAGQIVHPAPGHESGALTDELVASRPSMRGVGSSSRPGVVHRLDIDTSGVVVFAKTQAAYLSLRRQFESHRDIRKTYLAVCHGSPSPAKGELRTRIDRHCRVVPAEGSIGDLAVTRYETLGRRGGLSLVRFDIETGRMHQIRVHARALGAPIAGDSLYGDAEADRHMRRRPARTLLHAAELSFLHPSTGRRVTFSAPPPADIVYAL